MQPVVRVFTECGMCKVVAVEEWPLRAVVKFNKAKFNGKVGCPNCGGYSYKITEIEPIISDQNDEVPF